MFSILLASLFVVYWRCGILKSEGDMAGSLWRAKEIDHLWLLDLIVALVQLTRSEYLCCLAEMVIINLIGYVTIL